MNYKTTYTTVADLLADDGFLAWYCRTDKTRREEWDDWMLEEKHQQLAEEAVKLLSVIISPNRIKYAAGEEQQINASFERLTKKIAGAKEFQERLNKHLI